MRVRKTKEQYIEYLNKKYNKEEALSLTKYIWDNSDKWTKSQMNRAKAMVNHGCIGQCIKTYDPVEFQDGYMAWCTDIRNLQL